MSNYSAYGPTPLGENSKHTGGQSQPVPSDPMQQLQDAVGANGHNGHHPTPHETADKLVDRGIMPLPLEEGVKNPNRPDWQSERYTRADVPRVFARAKGLGARWGHLTSATGDVLTRNMVDIDLDTTEAILAAPFYLPPTDMRWGRASKPNSHWVYEFTTLDFQSPHSWSDTTPSPDVPTAARAGKHAKGQRLLELRDNGHTVAPGSINTHDGHPERVEWYSDGVPACVTPDAVTPKLPLIAAVALVARYWREGDRHDTALPLAGFLWHGGMQEDDALRFMEATCTAAGDTADLDNRLECVRTTYRRGHAGEPVTGGRTLEDHLHPTTIGLLRKWLQLKPKKSIGFLGPDYYPLLGDGDGDRFAAMWVGQVLYCAAEDQWYIWDGRRWKADTVKEIKERAKAVVYEYRRCLVDHQDRIGRDGVAPLKDCYDHAKVMGSDANIMAMLRSAESKPELRIAPEEFEPNPWLFNTLDCTLEVDPTTGDVHEHLHDPADRIRWLAPVHYQPDATHRLLEQLRTRYYPEPERWAQLLEMGAYSLTGQPKGHALQLHGPTGAGKSTTLLLFKNTWGDYAASLTDTSLAKNPHKGGDVARPDLLRVARKRLVIITEVDPDIRFDPALFKAILGTGDPLGLRTLYDKRGGEDTLFTCSVWMSGNEPYGPAPNEVEAFARLETLACEHAIPRATRDAADERDTTDASIVGTALLAAVLRALKTLYRDHGGEPYVPDSSRAAQRTLREGLDPWTPLVNDLFEVTGDENDGVKKSEAWAVAKYTMEAEGERVYKPRAAQAAFEQSLAWRVGKPTHRRERWNNTDYWPGLRWRDDVRRTWGTSISLPNWKADV